MVAQEDIKETRANEHNLSIEARAPRNPRDNREIVNRHHGLVKFLPIQVYSRICGPAACRLIVIKNNL